MSNLTKTLLALPLCSIMFLTGCNKAETPKATAPATEKATTEKTTTTTTTSNTATATAKESADVAHKTREKIMKEWGGAMKAMGGMIKDPSTFKADAFKAEASKLDNSDVWTHFAEGTKTKGTKDEIWSKATDFQAEVDKYKKAVIALNTATATATNVDAVKGAFGDVGASCKSCHQSYRIEE